MARLGLEILLLMVLMASWAAAQSPPPQVESTSDQWRSTSGASLSATATSSAGTARSTADSRTSATTRGGVQPIEPLAPVSTEPRRPIATVKHGIDKLPNDHGQVWREYDITPYTLRVTSTNRPEQAIVDWILRETGYEAWHGVPLGLLSADARSLKVYHTPEMHSIVSDVVDRFVNASADSHAFGAHVVTVGHPNWRAKALPILQPVPVQTQGIQAWLVAKEDYALLLAELRKRSDFREHSSPHLLVSNGQSTVVSSSTPHTYVANVTRRAEAWPAFEPEMGQFDEGFALEMSPLLSVDGQMIDAVLKCTVDQLEKLVPVMLEVPSLAAPRQRAKIEVPQVSQCRLHERFRWPADRVLVVAFGMVPTPGPVQSNPLGIDIPLPLPSAPNRADLIVFIESRGAAVQDPAAARTGQAAPSTYHGRY